MNENESDNLGTLSYLEINIIVPHKEKEHVNQD